MMDNDKKVAPPEGKKSLFVHSCCGSPYMNKSGLTIFAAILVSIIIFCAGYKIGMISAFFNTMHRSGGFCQGPNQSNMMWQGDDRGMIRFQKFVPLETDTTKIIEATSTTN